MLNEESMVRATEYVALCKAKEVGFEVIIGMIDGRTTASETYRSLFMLM